MAAGQRAASPHQPWTVAAHALWRVAVRRLGHYHQSPQSHVRILTDDSWNVKYNFNAFFFDFQARRWLFVALHLVTAHRDRVHVSRPARTISPAHCVYRSTIARRTAHPVAGQAVADGNVYSVSAARLRLSGRWTVCAGWWGDRQRTGTGKRSGAAHQKAKSGGDA